ncbi:hypothetical protein JW707_03085, partial [Candidatus Woesearchaeota archaeon]|nr:hypothetical protein [Candidatus Woesearchaeota archaeon]
MEVKKAIKKMVALGTGLALVGATIFGAAAADLSDYPSPMFIKDGKFNGIVVVGDSAAASDVIGSVDIATSLQYSSTTVSEVSVGEAVVPTVSEGVRIAKSGDELNIGEDLNDVEDKFTSSDLPDVLPDGIFEDEDGGEEDFEQTLELGADAEVLMFYQDDDDAPEAGMYLHVVKSGDTYTYVLEFDDSIGGTGDTDATEDVQELLESATIEIQGNTYTITDVEHDDTDAITEITLQAGESTIWLEEGVELSKAVAGVSHKVVLEDVNEDEDKCGISVDGTLAWVDKGKTKTVNGMDIGVTDAIVVHSAGKDTDVCEVNLGASQLTLTDGKKVNVNGADIKGSEVTIDKDGTTLEWDGLTVTYSADDDVYLAEGETWVDPVFGNFEMTFGGMTAVTEEMMLDLTGTKDAEFTFTNTEGDEVVIPFRYDVGTDTIMAGTDVDELVLREGDTCSGTASVEDCEGNFIFVVAPGGESRMMEIETIDVDDEEIVLNDLTKDKDYTDDIFVNGSQSTVTLGSFMDILITVNETAMTIDIDVSEDTLAETELGAEIDFGSDWVDIYEEIPDETDFPEDDAIYLALEDDDSEMSVSAPTSDDGLDFYPVEEDSDVEQAMTTVGSLVEYDSEEDDYTLVVYPDEEAYGNVFISPIGSELVSAAMGGAVTTTTV